MKKKEMIKEFSKSAYIGFMATCFLILLIKSILNLLTGNVQGIVLTPESTVIIIAIYYILKKKK